MSTITLSAATTPIRFYELDEHPHPEGYSTMLGFWIYLMSDCLIFAILFACYAVLGGNYAAGPGPKDLFDLGLVAVNTAMLLLSSITYGFAMIAMQRGARRGTQLWLAVTVTDPPGRRSPEIATEPCTAAGSATVTGVAAEEVDPIALCAVTVSE